MTTKLKILASTLLLALTIGCSTASLNVPDQHGITSEKVATISEGETTKEQIEQLFGVAEMEVLSSEGTTYFYKDLSLNTLWVVFNEDDTIAQFEWSD